MRTLLMTCLAVFTVVPVTWAQSNGSCDAPNPCVDLGIDPSEGTLVCCFTLVDPLQLDWLRVRFTQLTLDGDSFVILRSVNDPENYQRLDAVSAAQWQHRSAFLRGPEVQVQVYAVNGAAAHAEAEVYLPQAELTSLTRDHCDQDDRQLCADPDDDTCAQRAVARLVGQGPCTAWLIGSGDLVSAGHCFNNLEILEFQVPATNAYTGHMNHPHPDHQYAFDPAGIERVPKWEIGDDWMIFRVYPNPNTGLMPLEAQQTFFRVSDQGEQLKGMSNELFNSGFGTTQGQPSGQRQRHKAMQTAEGDLVDIVGTTVAHRIDTESGSSGSPLYERIGETQVSIAIHTNGGCASNLYRQNHGTSLRNLGWQAALARTTLGERYVDGAHPNPGNGSLLRPYTDVRDGVDLAPDGTRLLIAPGTYQTDKLRGDGIVLEPIHGTVILD